MALSTMIPASFGYGDQYGSENTNTGAFGTLEEQLELAERKVATAASNPATQASSGSVAKNVLMDKVNTLINSRNS